MAEQFDFGDLHALSAVADHWWEDQPVGAEFLGVVREENIDLFEAVRAKGRNAALADHDKVLAVIGAFESVRGRVALRSVVGRGKRDAAQDCATDARRYGETSVE